METEIEIERVETEIERVETEIRIKRVERGEREEILEG